MILRDRRRRRIVIATLVVATGAPLSTAWWIGRETDALAAHLARASGTSARIGAVDADLTGTIRLSDVAVGSIARAESVEASVAMSSLVSGELGADEIRVRAPQLDLHVDADGDSDLARLARTFARARPAAHGAAPSRLRRIVVDGGRLTAQIAGVGTLEADGVELVPDATGVRVVTGEVRVHGGEGPVAIDLVFARSAAELALPGARVGRVLAVAGTGTLAIAAKDGERTLALHDVAAGRLDPTPTARALEIRATLDDAGSRRPIAASLHLATAPGGQATAAIEGDHIPLTAFAPLAPGGLVVDGAHASGTIAVRRHGDALELAVDGALVGAALDHRAIAPAPVPLGGALHGTLALDLAPEHGVVVVRDARFEVGDARVAMSGWLRRAAPISGQLDVTLARTACSRVLDAVPPPLRGVLDGMTLAGELGAHAHLAIDLAAPDGEGVALATHFDNTCTVTDEPPAADVRALAGVTDQLYPDGTRARVGRGTPGWLQLDAIPPRVSAAFVSAEDGRFHEHRGFDATQIARSLEIDLREHRLARGGSTISQQLVKNAFLTQRRSLDRKIQEAILTWRLEARLTKAQILERYLNIIELGPHVYGLAAAAKHWFDALPRDLTTRQAAFLAALTSEPSSMTRRVRAAGGLDADSGARVDTILRAMRRDGAITSAELDATKGTPMHFATSALAPER